MKAESTPWPLVLMGTLLPVAVMIKLCAYGISIPGSASKHCAHMLIGSGRWPLVLMGRLLLAEVTIRPFAYAIPGLGTASCYYKNKEAEFTHWFSVPKETFLPVGMMVRRSAFGMRARENVSRRCRGMETAFSP